MTHLFAFAAGMLSILSPCVLPLAPVVLAGAKGKSKYGPVALMAGLVLSFTLAGLFIAQLGFTLGIGPETLRYFAATLLLLAGLFLLFSSLQQKFVTWIDPLLNGVRNYLNRFHASGFAGQGALGALLGIVWAPCIGPTLGAAAALAMQTETMPEAASVMAVFALGTGLPLLAVAYAGERLLSRKKKMSGLARIIKPVLAILLIYTGISILTGFDRILESAITGAMPQWLIDLTTRF